MRESARELVRSICATFDAFDTPGADNGDGPLMWSGYGEQRQRAERGTGAEESVLCGVGRVGSEQVVVICFEFGYLGGSIGEAAGNRVVRAFERARELRIPVISLVASGGSRLQEGIRALRQLQEIARACTVTRNAGIPHISVLRHPTTGGMWASLAAGADIVLALPGAEVAFGGSRVRPPEATGEAFTSEGKLADGQADRIVDRAALPDVLATLVALLHPRRLEAPTPVVVSGATAEDLPGTGWEAVRRARSRERARAHDYLDHYFPTRFELGGTDPGMRCGFGEHEGRPVAFAAQCGTQNAPGGFRAAARLVRLASQLRISVLTLVDTPGAANGADAERDGVGPAIAELFTAVAEAEVPVTTLVIGEGGSGGALALTSREDTWITSDAYFAVIAPEAAASILKQPIERVVEIADRLHLRPQDLLELGFVRGIVRPLGG